LDCTVEYEDIQSAILAAGHAANAMLDRIMRVSGRI
jgi:hypothetical protein